MKNLISLSLKYIRRQKMRTVLSFLCIMLSVFILNTVTAYFSSGLHSMKNYITENEGTWEVNLGNLLEKHPDKAEALDIIENHAAVSDYVCHNIDMVFYNSGNDENEMVYAEVSFGGNEAVRVSAVYYDGDEGNRELDSGRYGYMYSELPEGTENLSGDQVILPYWVKELGYDVGDKVTLSITPVKGRISEDSQQCMDTLEKIKKHNEERGEEDTYYILLGEDYPEGVAKTKVASQSLIYYILQYNGIDGIELTDQQRAEPYTVDIEIAGFLGKGDLRNYYQVSNRRGLDIYGGSGCEFAFSDHAQAYSEDFPTDSAFNTVSCWIRTIDNYDFEECLTLILRDLGYREDQYYEFFTEGEPGEIFHHELLALEYKSVDAIANMLPYVAVGLIIAVLIWFLVRFIIDNAFEISVQERSVQFAQLRVMGASRAQIMAVVFTEAIFYIITAVPIGTLLAFLCCRSVIGSFARAGIDYFVFAVDPVITMIGVLLCVIAIFTSANTSALWATRKLSPAEALSFGKPRKKHRAGEKRHKKSKTDKNRKGFIVRYTLKNIFRTKKRFFIATVAMSLSVMVFTICAFIGIYGYGEILPVLKNNDYFDFYIHCDSIADLEKKSGILRASECISRIEYTMRLTGYSGTPHNDKHNNDIVLQVVPYNDTAFFRNNLSVIQKEEYERYVQELAGMSYEEFVAAGGAIYIVDPYGRPVIYDEHNDPIPQYDNYYSSASELGFTELPTLDIAGKTSVKLIGSLCSDKIYGRAVFDELLIPMELAEQILEDDGEDFVCGGTLYITVNGEQNYDAAVELCESLAGKGRYGNNYFSGTGLKTFIGAVVKLVLMLLLSVWLVGVLTMTNCVNTSVLNRQKELLMMRSVGMSRKQLAGTVILESVLFSAFSVIIGTLLGSLSFVILKLAMGYVNTPLFMGAAIGTVLISLLLNLIFAILAALPGMDSLKRRMR